MRNINFLFMFVISVILASCTKEQPYVAPVQDNVAAYIIGGKEIKVDGNNLYTNGYHFTANDPQDIIDAASGQMAVVVVDSTGKILVIHPFETIAPCQRPRASSFDVVKGSIYSWQGEHFSINGERFLWPRNLSDKEVGDHHSVLFVNTRYGAVVVKLDEHKIWDWYSLAVGILFILVGLYQGSDDEGGDGCLCIFFWLGGIASLARFIILAFF